MSTSPTEHKVRIQHPTPCDALVSVNTFEELSSVAPLGPASLFISVLFYSTPLYSFLHLSLLPLLFVFSLLSIFVLCYSRFLQSSLKPPIVVTCCQFLLTPVPAHEADFTTRKDSDVKPTDCTFSASFSARLLVASRSSSSR